MYRGEQKGNKRMKRWIIYSIILSFVAFAIPSFAQVDSVATQKDQGVPVIFKKDTLFRIYAKLGSYKPAERVDIIQRRITSLADQPSFYPDSIVLEDDQTAIHIVYQDIIIVTVTEGDATGAGMSKELLAKAIRKKLQTSLAGTISFNLIKTILVRIGLTILEILILYFLLKYINKLFVFTKKWLIKSKDKYFKGFKLRDYEFLDAQRQLSLAVFANTILRWVVIIFILYLSLPILFSIFPWTQTWAETLFSYVLNPVRNMAAGILGFIPNLFAIAVIFLATKYVVKFISFLSNEVEKGSLVIEGFYKDWAKPTFSIVKIVLYAFMFIVIFPYLPGSDSEVFRGVSVFLGILVSLGSSSAISNGVAGLVITYMRPFKIGDRIKIGEITGEVMEKTMLVTRIRTIKNEEITVPNATIMSGHTINYTTSAKELGLILNTSITIGYDVPWKKVHELMINAALATNGILHEEKKRPFVLQTSLDDFYVAYQINAYTDQSHRMAGIYSELHQNIQDKFNEGGVEIMSPHYQTLRDGSMTTIPPNYLPPDYKQPPFHVELKKPE